MNNADHFVGIDLGGTKILTALVNRAGQIVAEDYRKTRAKRGLDSVLDRIVESVGAVYEAAQIDPTAAARWVRAVGIGAPGPVESEAGILTSPPNLPGWQQVPLRALMEDRLGLPTVLDNDANAAALGEFRFGAGRGSQQMLYVTVSTGIGAGFVLNGALYRGVDGAAGEVGHMTIVPGGPYCGCGNQGCLEAVSSGTAIARQGREVLARDASRTLAEMAAGDPESVTAEMVAEAARSADREAGRIIAEAMDYLGIGIANLVNIFNPDLVVIGGGLTKMGAALFDPVRSGIRRRSVPVAAQRVQVVLAELGDRVGVIGAAAIAMEASAAVGQMGE